MSGRNGIARRLAPDATMLVRSTMPMPIPEDAKKQQFSIEVSIVLAGASSPFERARSSASLKGELRPGISTRSSLRSAGVITSRGASRWPGATAATACELCKLVVPDRHRQWRVQLDVMFPA